MEVSVIIHKGLCHSGVYVLYIRMHALPGCQLVLLLAGPRSCSQRQLAHRGQVADHLVQFAELGADLQQLAWIGSQVLYVCAARLLQHVLPFMTTDENKALEMTMVALNLMFQAA